MGGTAPAKSRDVRLGVGWSDFVDGEGVVVVEQVAAGVGDVGASGEADRADGQVAEGCHRWGCGTGSELGVVFVEGDVTHPVDLIFNAPARPPVVVELSGAGLVGGQADDPEDNLLGLPDTVEFAAVAAQAEDLVSPGEQGVVGGGGA